jgi:hypothetical protein
MLIVISCFCSINIDENANAVYELAKDLNLFRYQILSHRVLTYPCAEVKH